MFSLYVNELPQIFDSLMVKHIFYADDLQIYVHTTKNDFTEGMARLEEAALQVSKWATSSRLCLNSGKTKAIFFGSRKNVNDITLLKYSGLKMQDGVIIPFDESLVSLGVTLDRKLIWKPHIDVMTKKVNK